MSLKFFLTVYCIQRVVCHIDNHHMQERWSSRHPSGLIEFSTKHEVLAPRYYYAGSAESAPPYIHRSKDANPRLRPVYDMRSKPHQNHKDNHKLDYKIDPSIDNVQQTTESPYIHRSTHANLRLRPVYNQRTHQVSSNVRSKAHHSKQYHKDNHKLDNRIDKSIDKFQQTTESPYIHRSTHGNLRLRPVYDQRTHQMSNVRNKARHSKKYHKANKKLHYRHYESIDNIQQTTEPPHLQYDEYTGLKNVLDIKEPSNSTSTTSLFELDVIDVVENFVQSHLNVFTKDPSEKLKETPSYKETETWIREPDKFPDGHSHIIINNSSGFEQPPENTEIIDSKDEIRTRRPRIPAQYEKVSSNNNDREEAMNSLDGGMDSSEMSMTKKDRQDVLDSLVVPSNKVANHRPKKPKHYNLNYEQSRSDNIFRQPTKKSKKARTPSTTPRINSLKDVDPTLSPYNLLKHLANITRSFSDVKIFHEILGKTESFNNIVILKICQKKKRKKCNKKRDFRKNEPQFADESLKKIVFIVHGLSAMGLSQLQCLSQAKEFTKLLGYYLRYLDSFDIFVIPMANPDGIINQRHQMIWNKNMSPQDACPGVALDRNFDVAWKSSKNISSCSQHYPGPTPFSEAETEAIRKVMHKYSSRMHAYFHVHAGTVNPIFFKGDAVLYPKGYEDVNEEERYINLKEDIEEKIRDTGFRTLSVTVDSLNRWYGTVSGTSVDYCSTVYGIPYCLELVMQLYQDDGVPGCTLQTVALTEIWEKIIDTIFKNMIKGLT